MEKRVLSASILMSLALMAGVVTEAQTPSGRETPRTGAVISQFGFSDRSWPFGKWALWSVRPAAPNAHATAPLFSPTPANAGPNLPVIGSGTIGKLTKWLGFSSSNSSIGDSSIFEDKSGLVGIGTTTPTSKLTVAGVIESTGGFKFADGTVQTTGGLASIFHDGTLSGNGTSNSP